MDAPYSRFVNRGSQSRKNSLEFGLRAKRVRKPLAKMDDHIPLTHLGPPDFFVVQIVEHVDLLVHRTVVVFARRNAMRYAVSVAFKPRPCNEFLFKSNQTSIRVKFQWNLKKITTKKSDFMQKIDVYAYVPRSSVSNGNHYAVNCAELSGSVG